MSVKVTISDCRAGAEPVMFGKEGGGRVARVSVASNEHVKDAAGNVREEVTWVPVVAFGPAARFLEASVHKGERLAIEGELRNRSYDKDGQKHTVSEVHVIPGRGSIALKDALGARPANEHESSPAA